MSNGQNIHIFREGFSFLGEKKKDFFLPPIDDFLKQKSGCCCHPLMWVSAATSSSSSSYQRHCIKKADAKLGVFIICILFVVSCTIKHQPPSQHTHIYLLVCIFIYVMWFTQRKLGRLFSRNKIPQTPFIQQKILGEKTPQRSHMWGSGQSFESRLRTCAFKVLHVHI